MDLGIWTEESGLRTQEACGRRLRPEERLHEDLVRAEFAIQGALSELKQHQQEWAAQHRARLEATTAELRQAAKRELAVLARARNKARKKANEAISDWDTLVGEYTQAFGPQVVAA